MKELERAFDLIHSLSNRLMVAHGATKKVLLDLSESHIEEVGRLSKAEDHLKKAMDEFQELRKVLSSVADSKH